MFPKPILDLKPNTYQFEVNPLIKPTGFREYDARWWYGVPSSPKLPELNLMGVTALGMGIGTYLGETGIAREVVTGHDYRAYSGAIKTALITGLMASGCLAREAEGVTGSCAQAGVVVRGPFRRRSVARDGHLGAGGTSVDPSGTFGDAAPLHGRSRRSPFGAWSWNAVRPAPQVPSDSIMSRLPAPRSERDGKSMQPDCTPAC